MYLVWILRGIIKSANRTRYSFKCSLPMRVSESPPYFVEISKASRAERRFANYVTELKLLIMVGAAQRTDRDPFGSPEIFASEERTADVRRLYNRINALPIRFNSLLIQCFTFSRHQTSCVHTCKR